jgi:hypothetical protein
MALLLAILGTVRAKIRGNGDSGMTYLLWIALCCGLVWMIRLGIEARANYIRHEKSVEHIEKLHSAVK